MPDVLEHEGPAAPPPTLPPLAPVDLDERPARHTLLAQIETLETEMAGLFTSAWPRKGLRFAVAGHGGGPRLLPLAELEALRDEMAAGVESARRRLSERTLVEDDHRRHIEEMLLEPEKHKWVRISNEDIGEPGCKHWHVRPRMGILGMLMNWWRVHISSGCPLAEGHGLRPCP